MAIPCILLINQAKVLYSIFALFTGLFMFAWNIVGAVALFRDAPQCLDEAYSLWAMCLAVLIIQWIGMGLSCISGITTNKKD